MARDARDDDVGLPAHVVEAIDASHRDDTRRGKRDFERLGPILSWHLRALQFPGEYQHILDERDKRVDHYRTYLQTDVWYQKRQDVLRRANHTCERCRGSNLVLEVHHLEYGPRGEEDVADLLAVCSTCHSELHEPADVGAR